LRGPRQRDPATGADLLAEFAVEPAPRPRARVGGPIAQGLAQELADLRPERLGLGRQIQELEVKGRDDELLFVRLAPAQLHEDAVGVLRMDPRDVRATVVDPRALLLQMRHAAGDVLAL